MKFLILIIIILAIPNVFSDELKCSFVQLPLLYSCETLAIFEQNSLISVISGNHLQHNVTDFFEDSDVKCFRIPDTSGTLFLPLKVCSQFATLREIVIHGYKVIAISREVFAGCVKVLKVVVSGTMIQWLSENTFCDMPDLEELDLSNNQIKALQQNLLLHNKFLKVFTIRNNKLEQIDLQFKEDMRMINLEGNICVSEWASESLDIKYLNKIIMERCANSLNSLLRDSLQQHETVKPRLVRSGKSLVCQP